MKRLLPYLFLTLISFQLLPGQPLKLTGSIDRNDPAAFVMIDSTGDSVHVTRNESGTYQILPDRSLTLVRGEGRQRDEFGEREKNKRYLLSRQDTLAMIRESSQTVEFADGTLLNFAETPEGWHITDQTGEVVSEILLSWNQQNWYVEIDYPDAGMIPEGLNDMLILSLPNLAHERSDVDSSSYDSDFWFIMWVVALAS